MNLLRSLLEDTFNFAVEIAPLFIVIFLLAGFISGFVLLIAWLAS